MKYPIALCVLLSACSAHELVRLHPEASYLGKEKVASVSPANSITLIGSSHDEYGNWMPAFPTITQQSHRIVHLSPVPKDNESIGITCDNSSTSCNSLNSANKCNWQRTGSESFHFVQGHFQAGKTYQVYCNINGLTTKDIQTVVREVAANTTFNTPSPNAIRPQPNDQNRIRFESVHLHKTLYFGSKILIRNWDGKFKKSAELPAPTNNVSVQCGSNKVPLTGHFQAGKTYRVDCRQRTDGFSEAYIIESK